MSVKLGSTNISLVNQGSTISNRGYLGNKMVYGSQLPNTFIGNTTQLTESAIASALRLYPSGDPLPESEIQFLDVDGNNVQFYINVEHEIVSSFGIDITYFKGYGNKCKRIRTNQSLGRAAAFCKFEMDDVIEISDRCWCS